jgi:hypothetical protein
MLLEDIYKQVNQISIDARENYTNIYIRDID